MSRYVILVEPTETGYSAYVPDVDGCVATGETREEVERLMQEALAFHLELMRERGEPLPEPTTDAAFVEVAG